LGNGPRAVALLHQPLLQDGAGVTLHRYDITDLSALDLDVGKAPVGVLVASRCKTSKMRTMDAWAKRLPPKLFEKGLRHRDEPLVTFHIKWAHGQFW
jgi:hypothetical protein